MNDTSVIDRLDNLYTMIRADPGVLAGHKTELLEIGQ